MAPIWHTNPFSMHCRDSMNRNLINNRSFQRLSNNLSNGMIFLSYQNEFEDDCFYVFLVSRFLECTWNNETDTVLYYTEEHSIPTITNKVHVLVFQKSRCAIFEPYSIFKPSPIWNSEFSYMTMFLSFASIGSHYIFPRYLQSLGFLDINDNSYSIVSCWAAYYFSCNSNDSFVRNITITYGR